MHGVLVLLTALEAAFAAAISETDADPGKFRKFVAFGDQVAFALCVEKDGAAQ